MTDSAKWFTSDLGHCVQENSALELKRMIPPAYFSLVVDLGPGSAGYWNNLDAGQMVSINPFHREETLSTVIGEWEELPLGRNTVDLIVLQHTLDFSNDPRRVLRESIEVLTPEGWIAVIGFNPIGIWSVPKARYRDSSRMPWSARFVAANRIQDWLRLLGADIVEVTSFFYRPPINSTIVLTKLHMLESIGSKWWPKFSGLYLIVAQKKELAKKFVLPGRKLSGRGRVANALHPTKVSQFCK